MKEIIKRLLARELSSNSIALATGVSQAVISKLRNGKKEIGNLTINSGEKLYKYEMELEVMEKLESKIIRLENENNITLIDSICQYFTDIENDGNNHYSVDYVLLNEVEYNEKIYFEVGVYRTEEVQFGEEVTQDNVELLEEKWLAIDQQGENYVESIFFEKVEDAEEYIKLVLKGHETFEETAKVIGVIK